jgi:hypothetical protein
VGQVKQDRVVRTEIPLHEFTDAVAPLVPGEFVDRAAGQIKPHSVERLVKPTRRLGAKVEQITPALSAGRRVIDTYS